MSNTKNSTVSTDNAVIEVDKLKEHPKNAEIYGKEDISDLVDSIKKYGIKNPIMVNENLVIVSGHRRYKAALELVMNKVPYIIRKFNSYEDETEILILENAYRTEKTHEQRVREGKVLEEVIAERARHRKLETLKQNTDTDREKSSHTDKGRTRDNVAKKVGISSGKQYEQSKKVINEIDNLKANGNETDAELLKTVLNKAPSTAHSFVTKVGIGNLTQEDKEGVRSGKVSPNSFIKEKSSKKSINPKTAETSSIPEFIDTDNLKVEEILIKNPSLELEELILLFHKSLTAFICRDELSENMDKNFHSFIEWVLNEMEDFFKKVNAVIGDGKISPLSIKPLIKMTADIYNKKTLFNEITQEPESMDNKINTALKYMTESSHEKPVKQKFKPDKLDFRNKLPLAESQKKGEI